MGGKMKKVEIQKKWLQEVQTKLSLNVSFLTKTNTYACMFIFVSETEIDPNSVNKPSSMSVSHDSIILLHHSTIAGVHSGVPAELSPYV